MCFHCGLRLPSNTWHLASKTCTHYHNTHWPCKQSITLHYSSINLHWSFELHGQKFTLLIRSLLTQWSLPLFCQIHIVLNKKQYKPQLHALTCIKSLTCLFKLVQNQQVNLDLNSTYFIWTAKQSWKGCVKDHITDEHNFTVFLVFQCHIKCFFINKTKLDNSSLITTSILH